MRDLAVLIFTLGSLLYALKKPWIGVLALCILAYLNPHRYAWGFSRSFPVYTIVFFATVIGLALNSKNRQPFPWIRETKLFIALLAWFTLTTYWNPDFPGPAQEQWIKVMKVYVGIFPTLWLITTRDQLRWLLTTIALSFGLIGLKGGMFALATGFHYRVWGPDNTFYGGNNEIALALNMVLPLLFLAAKEAKSKSLKILLLGSFVFSIFAVISSWSRGGLLGLCAVLGAMVMAGKRKWLSIPIIAVGVFLLLPQLPEEWFSRMETIKTYEQDNSAMGRINSWQFAVDRAMKDPLTGGGFGSFMEQEHDSHSAYFQILGHHGFVALGLWMSLLFGTLVALERLRRMTRYRENLAWIGEYARAVQISLLGYSAGAAFLGAAYWDIFYHLVAVCALLKVMAYRAYAPGYAEEAGPSYLGSAGANPQRRSAAHALPL